MTSALNRRELAEDLMAHLPLPRRGVRRRRDDATFSYQPGEVPFFANVSAVRADPDQVERLVDDASTWFAQQGRGDFTWFLGPSSRPHDLLTRLTGLGAQPMATATAMLLTVPPPAVAEVEIRAVAGAEDLLEYRALLRTVISRMTDHEENRRAVEADNDEAWADLRDDPDRLSFVAYVGGEPAAAGGLVMAGNGLGVLSGGATRPQFQGRGCYRALVRARWDVAAARGLTALAVQASDRSAPVLERLGFQTVGELTILRQSADGAGATSRP